MDAPSWQRLRGSGNPAVAIEDFDSCSCRNSSSTAPRCRTLDALDGVRASKGWPPNNQMVMAGYSGFCDQPPANAHDNPLARKIMEGGFEHDSLHRDHRYLEGGNEDEALLEQNDMEQ